MKKQIISVLASFITALSVTGTNALSAGYGQGTAVDEHNCPTGAVEFNSAYSDKGTYSLTGDKSRIIITFDQGYENGYTSS